MAERISLALGAVLIPGQARGGSQSIFLIIAGNVTAWFLWPESGAEPWYVWTVTAAIGGAGFGLATGGSFGEAPAWMRCRVLEDRNYPPWLVGIRGCADG